MNTSPLSRLVLRQSRQLPHNARSALRSRTIFRYESTQTEANLAKRQAQVTKATRWAPKFLRKYVDTLRTAPITTVISFLILHELTAIVPLFGLAGAFHYYHWLPPFFSEGEWVLRGIGLFSSWFRKRGWITDGEARDAQRLAEEGQAEEVEKKGGMMKTVGKWFGRGEAGTRWVVEFATAYAVVKAFLPLRLVLSVTWAPAFARWTVIPVRNWVKARFTRNKAAKVVDQAVKKS